MILHPLKAKVFWRGSIIAAENITSWSLLYNILILAKLAPKIFFFSAILHPLLVKVFKCETTYIHCFSPRIPNLNFFWTSTFGKWGQKKTFIWYLKSEHTNKHAHTDRQSYGQIDFLPSFRQTIIWTNRLPSFLPGSGQLLSNFVICSRISELLRPYQGGGEVRL